ncbi:MAG TPA: quinolinate synthase NadA, partial [Acidimicrobiales bacterium]|nr:quinolinate synthase NadA [Acidimicrobiales bacterium]
MIRLQTRLPDEYSRAPSDELAARVADAKARLGSRLVLLGHHYQREEVIAFADARGDSFGLSRFAAAQEEAEYVVFCGVHFMAESADVLTADHQQVVLPDLNAGCSMADMADEEQVEQVWAELGAVTDVERIVPITYMNSSAALKAFVARHGGAVCTSSNARSVLSWALGLDGASAEPGGHGDKVLFVPDQHLGRNTGFQLGFGAGDMAVVDPTRPLGGLED